ncbi:MAG: sugar ABC transporter permease [Chloroflexi bacterium]|uniref:carbohydrate ABC transporter permease n=1 Tax=Candidatus Flexifilum breve TaxID=3140694 RepID=UPI003136EFD8|nr:sugar ABC transporter permease [Chloroflexota bacterium]
MASTARASDRRPHRPGFSLRTLFSPITWLLGQLYQVIINVVDFLMHPLQNAVGVRGMAYIFVLPNLLIFAIFILLPMLLNFYYAFTGGTNLFPEQRPYVGLENLNTLFTCGNFLDPNTCRADIFWRAMMNTGGYVVAQVALTILLSLISALALNKGMIGRGFFRSAFFYPVLLSPVVVALIWKWILQQDGLLNALIVGLGGDRQPFLLTAQWAQAWVVVISVWAQMGFYTLILLAGVQAIPGELYEAASIDGANPWQSFRSITLPMLMPTMFVVVVLSLIRAVQIFDQVFAFTGGGPGTATTYMVQYIYTIGFANQQNQYGLASAASLVMAFILLLLTAVQLWLGRRSEAT